jgi:hypothetical protein
MSKVTYERIYCPQCGSILSGMIIGKPGYPFHVHDAYCPDCDYFVSESEWETVDEYKKLLDSKVADV